MQAVLGAATRRIAPLFTDEPVVRKSGPGVPPIAMNGTSFWRILLSSGSVLAATIPNNASNSSTAGCRSHDRTEACSVQSTAQAWWLRPQLRRSCCCIERRTKPALFMYIYSHMWAAKLVFTLEKVVIDKEGRTQIHGPHNECAIWGWVCI